MKWKDIKKLIEEELNENKKNVKEASLNVQDTKFNLRTGVN